MTMNSRQERKKGKKATMCCSPILSIISIKGLGFLCTKYTADQVLKTQKLKG